MTATRSKHEVLLVTNYHKLFMNSDYARNIREISEISGGVLNTNHSNHTNKFMVKFLDNSR